MSSKIIKHFKILALAATLAITASAATSFAAEKPKHWLKKCITSDQSIRTCLVTEAIILENIAKKIRIQLASIRIKSISNTKRLVMYIQVPNKVLLQSGLRFQIDKGQTRVAPFSICYDKACEAEISLNNEFITALKKGNQIKLYFLKFDGKPVTIKVPLAGFTVGFNSKGEDITLPPVEVVDEGPQPLPDAKPLPVKK